MVLFGGSCPGRAFNDVWIVDTAGIERQQHDSSSSSSSTSSGNGHGDGLGSRAVQTIVAADGVQTINAAPEVGDK
jgi:hypothetical protein